MSKQFENWISGFVDGEGSFHIDLMKFSKMKTGIQVRPNFSITLHKRDKGVIENIKNCFGFGTIVIYKSTIHLRVTKLKDCLKLIKFFKKYRLLSQKRTDFKLWIECIEKIKRGEHLTRKGILEIFQLRKKMNLSKKGRRFELVDIKMFLK